ncbi:class I SAM-dependent methyltransferase [Lysobacter solisilvae (ex Woo and Kim 2020)]|uniref:Methyltransferase domain-containing protein n=1 Tax=Agrilutibacter terrestris TaxID=2865112 RepID=A0A7H0FZ63_9GAMM|nr:class I SAM-dependent methyltransferase [Lysobacter terrestris]QNP41329.1 methyltransferase domain-containing protein [Lysobacter terrestris]
MTQALDRCRICGNTHLEQVLDLGEQMLTGVFPRSRDAQVTTGPLRLVKCFDKDGCGLLQLAHSYDLGEMYGDNYGYRSGLNASMVRHLHAKVERVLRLVSLREGDLVVDVGANDGTTLGAYPESLGADLLGIDPTGAKFRQYYKPHVDLCADFFTADTLRKVRPGKRVRVLTSFSMFYDLEAPMAFMRDVHDVLADDGVWVFEQSYMPTMLDALSYDTVCHEHLEYYALRQVKWMADRVGFTIVDLEFNDVNGGSFSVTAAKSTSGMAESPVVARVLAEERAAGLDTLAPFEDFARRTAQSRDGLRAFIECARAEGKSIAALGASTKGNVLLQYCGITTDDIAEVGEVNPDKFGAMTPGTYLPIAPESDVLAHGHDYHLVLPWHFRRHFLANPAYAGRTLVFPLPELQALVSGAPA